MIDAIWLLAPTVPFRRLLVMAPKEGTAPVTPRKLEKKLAAPIERRRISETRWSFASLFFNLPRATSSLLGLMAYPNLAEFSFAATIEST